MIDFGWITCLNRNHFYLIWWSYNEKVEYQRRYSDRITRIIFARMREKDYATSHEECARLSLEERLHCAEDRDHVRPAGATKRCPVSVHLFLSLPCGTCVSSPYGRGLPRQLFPLFSNRPPHKCGPSEYSTIFSAGFRHSPRLFGKCGKPFPSLLLLHTQTARRPRSIHYTKTPVPLIRRH